MAAFSRSQRRFDCNGICLSRAMDNVPQGKFPVLENVRSVLQGTLQNREGLVAVAGAAFGNPIYSVTRFDDATPFASTANLYVIGAGGNLYVGSINGPFPQVDTGYSGDPLSFVSATPPQSPQPWLFVADEDRMRKLDANGNVFQFGVAAPTAEPSSALQALGLNVVQSTLSGPLWGLVGTRTTGFAITGRVNTTIDQHLFDSGASGYASVVPVSFSGITKGMLVFRFGSSNFPLFVEDVTIAVGTTTIQAILYDAGATGLCTIQPAGSLGTGQVTAPSIDDLFASFNQPVIEALTIPGVPVPTVGGGQTKSPRPTFRQNNFPVNCLVSLGNTETVRILSVAVGRDGVQSFRCVTTSTHVVGESIVGLTAFRTYSATDLVNGDSLIDTAQEFTITPVAPDPQTDPPTTPTATGGIRGFFPAGKNLAQINGRATTPDDYVNVAIRATNCVNMQTVRVYFSVESGIVAAPAPSDFTQNYYFYEWRQNDISVAIQTTNTDQTATLEQARSIAIANQQLNAQGTQKDSFFFGLGSIEKGGHIYGVQASSSQLALGNNQWFLLRCRVADLIRVGTDTSKTLADIKAAEVLVSVQGGGAVTFDVDTLYLSGGYDPDVTGSGIPFVYRTRYRSSTTGGRSNPSPQIRAGVTPQRQPVLVTGVQSADPQVDLVDWFRFGGTLTAWTYAGTTPNDNPPTFLDVYGDSALTGGETLDFNLFPPFPTQDIPKSGTCNIAGTAVQWVSGDLFDTNWAPGSFFLVNSQTFTLYAQPSSTTRLQLNENAGSGTNVPFILTGPTLLGQNFGGVFGGPIGGSTFLFGLRDPINPGKVSWTNGNDTETASDRNSLDVTTAVEPLQAGYMWDGLPYVASTEQQYVLEPNFGSDIPFRPLVTPCGKGFWTPWAFCLTPQGIIFLAKDGIYLTVGGSAAVSLTDADLYPLFPHDGVAGQAVNGYKPVDMTATTDLRLAYVDGWITFDYKDTDGTHRSLSYWMAGKSWWPDVTTAGPHVAMRESAIGRDVHQMLIGGVDGTLYTSGGIMDGPNYILCRAQMVDDQGDVRRQKLYRDLMLDATQGGTVTVSIGFSNNSTSLTPVNLAGVTGRHQYDVDVIPNRGALGTNLTAGFEWTPIDPTTVLYALDIAFQMEPELASSWLSGPTTHGFRGYQQVARALIAYLSNTEVTLTVWIDGVLYSYTLPSTGGVYAKNQIVLQAKKGKAYEWGMQGAQPFLLFDRDMELWIQPWSAGGSYQIVRPF